MGFDPNRSHRKSIRLKGFDYSQAGAYFVTLVCQERECLLGGMNGSVVKLSPIGEIVERCWLEIPLHFEQALLDVYVLMPNHLHGVIWIRAADQTEENAAGPFPTPNLRKAHALRPPNGTVGGSLEAMMQNFKSVSTRKSNQLLACRGNKVWQRNYYERVIRNERELAAVWNYILENPLNWDQDDENPLR